jgi:formylglycine-generating enzyme required for sulfatase activity
MQATPVTQTQWELVMGENPSNFKSTPLSGNRPVEKITWDDAKRFIQKLNELDPHYTYRLPTEAEWEYAARAGTQTAYSFGEEAAHPDYAWSSENSGRQTHAVAGLKPNPAGLHDMHGNVWEWVEDGYLQNPPGGVDPVVLLPSDSNRVLRGGSWDMGAPQVLRSAHRIHFQPSTSGNVFGFRLLRVLKKP